MELLFHTDEEEWEPLTWAPIVTTSEVIIRLVKIAALQKPKASSMLLDSIVVASEFLCRSVAVVLASSQPRLVTSVSKLIGAARALKDVARFLDDGDGVHAACMNVMLHRFRQQLSSLPHSRGSRSEKEVSFWIAFEEVPASPPGWSDWLRYMGHLLELDDLVSAQAWQAQLSEALCVLVGCPAPTDQVRLIVEAAASDCSPTKPTSPTKPDLCSDPTHMLDVLTLLLRFEQLHGRTDQINRIAQSVPRRKVDTWLSYADSHLSFHNHSEESDESNKVIKEALSQFGLAVRSVALVVSVYAAGNGSRFGSYGRALSTDVTEMAVLLLSHRASANHAVLPLPPAQASQQLQNRLGLSVREKTNEVLVGDLDFEIFGIRRCFPTQLQHGHDMQVLGHFPERNQVNLQPSLEPA